MTERSKLSLNELRNLIKSGESTDPVVFLEAIMSGQDPRKLSDIYNLVMEINDFNNGEISKSDWCEIVDLVSDKYSFSKVTLAESINASKTLAEYLHPKRKQIEMSDSTVGSSGSFEPLTEDEIELFKEKFNEEF